MNNDSDVWRLDPDVINLNAGGLGSCPTPVLDVQARWREKMERRPHEFLLRELEGQMLVVREALGRFVGSDPEHLAMVPNATAGVNAVLRSLDFQPGDEVLTSNQEYNGCLNALDYVASRTGATVVRAPIPFPIEEPAQVIAALLGRVTKRTRLAMISHITSATALILPIGEIVSELNQVGVDVLIDGAHAPGLLDLDLDRLGAAYYSGNCHKWLCSPKGTGFLHVRKDKQRLIHPLVIGFRANDPRTDISTIQEGVRLARGIRPDGVPVDPRRPGLPGEPAAGRGAGIGRPQPGAGPASERSAVSDPRNRAAGARLDARGDGRAAARSAGPSARPAAAARHPAPASATGSRCRSCAGGRRQELESGVIRISCQAFNDRSDIDALAQGMTEVLDGIGVRR